MKELGNNLRRLLGLHALTTREASLNLGISEQALSELQSGVRSGARYATVSAIAALFDLPPGRLSDAPFEDLLAHELANVDRYRRVEQSLKRSGSRRGRPRSVEPTDRG